MSKEMITGEAKEVTTERLSQLATEIRIYSSNMLINIIEIGRRFEEAKSLCPYGEFGRWCKECTSYEQSMVENYIKIYREYGGGQLNLGGDFANSQSIAALGVTKLLELTKIPADERESFVVENNITSDTTVKELKDKIKALETENERLLDGAKETEQIRDEKIAELEADKERAEGEIAENEKTIEELKAKIEILENNPAAQGNSEELAQMIADAEDEEKEKLKADIAKLEEDNGKLKEKQKKSNDEIKRLKTDIEESERRSKARADQLHQANLEISKLKKAAEASGDMSLAKIEMLFSSVQNDLSELRKLIHSAGKEELLPKIKAVIEGVLN